MTADEQKPAQGAEVELKTRIWMNGSLEWFGYLGEETVYLGGREVPYPLREGDLWSNRFGDRFRVENGEICRETRTGVQSTDVAGNMNS